MIRNRQHTTGVISIADEEMAIFSTLSDTAHSDHTLGPIHVHENGQTHSIGFK
jgi:hypothetical protein